jgi:hypothetical protein
VSPDDEAVVMTVAPDPLPLAAALLGAAEPPALLLPLEHAATSTATPTALPTPAASRAGVDIRLIMEYLMVFRLLSSALMAAPVPTPPVGLSI